MERYQLELEIHTIDPNLDLSHILEQENDKNRVLKLVCLCVCERKAEKTMESCSKGRQNLLRC